MKRFLMLPLALLTNFLFAQQVDWNKLNQIQPDQYLLDSSRKPTQVLLLGTFHFAYPNMDGHKVDSSHYVDVLSPTRQAELKELATVIERFRPTRIYVESGNPRFHDSLYREYRQGRYKAGRNEIYQIGYRVAADMGLPKIYCVDASNFAQDNYERLPLIDSMWSQAALSDTLRDQAWNQRYSYFYNAMDSVAVRFTMLENFLLMAEPRILQRMHGHYFASGFNTRNNDGPDILSMWWFSRNFRIANQIMESKPAAGERIVVLFGNGHIPILRQIFSASPEFELVELKSLLK